MIKNNESDKLAQSKLINKASEKESFEADFNGIVIVAILMMVLGFGGKILNIIIHW